jgi:DNA repair protein RadC
MTLGNGEIHKGHRERMRHKFEAHGARTLESYELLEMLLYHAIPYKDTNPVSKKLLERFGSLEGVFGAKREELLTIDGIGETVADLIISAGEIINDSTSFAVSASVLDDYAAVGEFFVKHFEGVKTPTVSMLVLGNNMNFIGIKDLYELDYSSGAVRPEPFIEYALSNRASIAIIAHLHPYGPAFPTVGDIATNNLIADALADASVTLAEHYVISGGRFVGTMKHLQHAFCQSPELDRFLRSKEGGM